jgi:hypothetical protein
MIAAPTSLRAPREWIPDDFPKADDGWMGQVPPPAPRVDEAPARVDDAVTGYEGTRDAREAGWLGQVPPASDTSRFQRSDRVTPTAADVTGYESPHDAREAGWLGQVPPAPPTSSRPDPVPPRSTYANPHLAPEPWKADPPIAGIDPTLFG